jgi:hypothetical protein
LESNNLEQEINRKEIIRGKIALKGIEEVLVASTSRLNKLHEILIGYTPTVIFYVKNEKSNLTNSKYLKRLSI